MSSHKTEKVVESLSVVVTVNRDPHGIDASLIGPNKLISKGFSDRPIVLQIAVIHRHGSSRTSNLKSLRR